MSVHKSLHNNFIKTTPLACIIMASGKGERFGSNKLLVEFKGKPLLQHILETTSLPFAKRLVVTRYEAVVKLCHNLNIDAVLHDQPYQSDTVRIGLENLPQEDYAGFLFCTGDQPLLTQESSASKSCSGPSFSATNIIFITSIPKLSAKVEK